MNYLSVENVSKRFDERILLDKVSFGIDQGQKAALVGINGSGKSTLLKIIAGLEPPDNGIVTFRNGISMAFLSQNPEFDPNATILEAIFDSDNEMLQTIKEYEYVIFESQHNPALQDRLSSLIEAMDAMQAWDYEAQIQQILSRLGLHDLHQKTKVLSGGQRKRVALARILIDKPDFLIMDEPTNHLDLAVIEWLENYLSSQQMTLLLVTHDRYFLESVTNEIFELEGGNIYRYKGNYSYYLEKKAERDAQQQTEVEKAKNTYKKELEWIRRQPKARGTKAKYRVEAFDDIKEKFPDSELYGASADITNEKDVKRIWKTIDKDLGGIDILINNAALAGDGLTNGTPKEWQYIIDTNVMGYLTFSYESVERMKKQKSGHIINIGSMSADTQEETGTIYVATKAAIRGFSTALRKEINPLGIKLSLIEPGSVISEIHPMTKTVQRNKIKKMEMLEAEDVAMSVLFCLSQPQRCDIVSLKIRPHLQLI